MKLQKEHKEKLLSAAEIIKQVAEEVNASAFYIDVEDSKMSDYLTDLKWFHETIVNRLSKGKLAA